MADRTAWGSDSVIRNASCNKENSRLARSERQRRSDRASVHHRVRRQGQEVSKVVSQRNLFEKLPRVIESAGVECLITNLYADRRQLLVKDAPDQVGRHRLSCVKADIAVHPLPDLGAGDLSGGSIFHQIVNANCAVAAKPRLEVPQANVNVIA